MQSFRSFYLSFKKKPKKNEDEAQGALAAAATPVHQLIDLKDEKIMKGSCPASHVLRHQFKQEVVFQRESKTFKTADVVDMFHIIRMNLPMNPQILTPFGEKPICYADYTASGRSLACIEEYMKRVVMPMFANTHTETSATGLQTSAFREEARHIVMQSLNAPEDEFALIFTGSGSTSAIARLVGILGVKLPHQLLRYCTVPIPVSERPLIFISSQEHHSNELLWRETNTCDVKVVPLVEETGLLDLSALEHYLVEAKQVENRHLIIGSFNAGSNVTGLRNDTASLTKLMHRYGGYTCFDFAGAGPYVKIDMQGQEMDAVFLSPHKFVGGPGTPGILCVRRTFANCTGALQHPPSVPGGGTVLLVWGGLQGVESGVMYDHDLTAREESGTPAILEAIRCGLVFSLQNLVGIDKIEAKEGEYAARAVKRFQAHGNIMVMGEQYSEITSSNRLSITSVNMRCVIQGKVLKNTLTGEPMRLHHNFIATLLNDLFGIQSRSGCSCAGPYGFRLFDFPESKIFQFKDLIETNGFHGPKIGWARINFNYFISEEEFDFICSAIELIATHGYKLLPLYAFCMKTGMFWYNGVSPNLDTGELACFDRFANIRSLREVKFESNGTVKWTELQPGKQTYETILKEAKSVFDNAASLVRASLFRFRDLRRKDVVFPPEYEPLRFFVLASEVLPFLGITNEELAEAKKSEFAADLVLNPPVTQSLPKLWKRATFTVPGGS